MGDKLLNEKKYEFIEPAEIPEPKRMGIYDRIINEFLESELDSAIVTYEKDAKIVIWIKKSNRHLRIGE